MLQCSEFTSQFSINILSKDFQHLKLYICKILNVHTNTGCHSMRQKIGLSDKKYPEHS